MKQLILEIGTESKVADIRAAFDSLALAITNQATKRPLWLGCLDVFPRLPSLAAPWEHFLGPPGDPLTAGLQIPDVPLRFQLIQLCPGFADGRPINPACRNPFYTEDRLTLTIHRYELLPGSLSGGQVARWTFDGHTAIIPAAQDEAGPVVTVTTKKHKRRAPRYRLFLCIHCERVNRTAEPRWRQQCAFCKAGTLDLFPWRTVREANPDYPETPEHGQQFALYGPNSK